LEQSAALNAALAGTGLSLTPEQAAGIPNVGLLAGLLAGEVQPGLAALHGQEDLARAGSVLTQQQIADAMAQQKQEAGFSLGQVGVQGSNLALEQQALGQQLGPFGFQSQQRVLTEQEQALQNAAAQRALRGQITAAGAVSTSGAQQSWSDLLAQQALQGQQNALGARQQAFAYQQGQARLANAAKSLGISVQEVQARLDNALSQLGLQGSMDTNALAQTLEQLHQGYISGPLATIVQQVLHIAGIPLSATKGGS
jgi:hypothetical protein